MIEVKDKFVGLVNDPDYTHCTNRFEFVLNIRNNGLNSEELDALVSENLKKNGVIDSSESTAIFWGGWNSINVSEDFDADTQTLYRTRLFDNMSDYESSQNFINSVDTSSIVGKYLYRYELVSAEEV